MERLQIDRGGKSDLSAEWSDPSPAAICRSGTGAVSIFAIFQISTNSGSIDVYFQSIQPHYPLFRKPEFLIQHASGEVQQNLLSAMFAVSIANSTNIEVAGLGFSSVSETFALYAWQACSDVVLYGSPAALEDLKTLFLLGLYEFRNAPNRKAWSVTGHLVRQAYHYGLHQVESPGACVFLDPESATVVEHEELRYLWWSIYTLDTCCNLTIATPSTIDLDMVNTYLPCDTVENWTNGRTLVSRKDPLILRGDIQGLSELAMRVSRIWRTMGTDCEADTNFATRVINTYILRETSNIRQLATHNFTKRAQQRSQTQSNLIAALRLALPASYLDPRRDLTSGEPPKSHTLRLVNLIEINFGNMWQHLPKPHEQAGSRQWLMDWCAAVDITEQIVDIVRHWDPGFVYLADPAVVSLFQTSTSLFLRCLRHLWAHGGLCGSRAEPIIFLTRI